MMKPQEKYEDIFQKPYYPKKAEELLERIAVNLDVPTKEYVEDLIEIAYCCGYTDGYEDGKFFYEKIK